MNLLRSWGKRRNGTATTAAPVFFLHIPKTAGTSLRYWAWSHYPDSAIFPNARLIAEHGGAYPRAESLLGLGPEWLARLKLVFAHFPAAYAAHLPQGFLRGTLLREPYARVCSHVRHAVQKHLREGGEQPQNLGRWIEENWDRLERQLIAAQLRLLSQPGLIGHGQRSEKATLTRQDLAVAKEVLERYDFVGLTEAYDISTKLATTRLVCPGTETDDGSESSR